MTRDRASGGSLGQVSKRHLNDISIAAGEAGFTLGTIFQSANNSRGKECWELACEIQVKIFVLVAVCFRQGICSETGLDAEYPVAIADIDRATKCLISLAYLSSVCNFDRA